ncbi:hypothetical protein AG1IA_04662 [Rhizoctonia solani AG-1 IA]|uniref:Uncharacterized protein n=1 Tax=Thanatephorus cucumeris (strain AG1-IA) TaxID=983506 RepID=L8WWY6_THACA|nr:hypothetical protein AG1IA_04662 [Rhizoctonia solani AG-1 IA]
MQLLEYITENSLHAVSIRHHQLALIPLLPSLYITHPVIQSTKPSQSRLLCMSIALLPIIPLVNIRKPRLLIIQYVASTSSGKTAEGALARKNKEKLPIPFCCWRYRPTKAYFMYTIKWSVLQYVIIRPAVSIIGIICEALHILCQSSWSYKHPSVYLTAVDFVSISVALYGLILFYDLTKQELNGRRPLAKFLTIKLIVMCTFYQEFVFDALQNHGIIKATEYWTGSNIADGLNALAITIEMVLFAFFMMVMGISHFGIYSP